MRIEISIAKEKVKAMPKGSMEALRDEMTRRAGKIYESVEVVVKSAGSDGLSIQRVPDADDIKKVVEKILQDIWESADDWFF